jgi:DNA polymerase delta subunit 2
MTTGDDGQQCRIVLLPKFSESGEVVLVNTKSLEVRVQGFEL